MPTRIAPGLFFRPIPSQNPVHRLGIGVRYFGKIRIRISSYRKSDGFLKTKVLNAENETDEFIFLHDNNSAHGDPSASVADHKQSFLLLLKLLGKTSRF